MEISLVKKKTFIFILIILLISILSACDTDILRGGPTVEKISVGGMEQTYYFVGDELNLSKAIVMIVYENGTLDEVPLTKDMIDSSFNTDTPGKKQVKINFKNESTTFEIEVLDLIIVSVDISTMPTKTTYTEGVDFDVSGGTFDVLFEGGRVINVPMLNNNVTQYNPNILGSQNVKVTYRTESMSVPIVIVPKQLEKITVKTLPTNKSVFVGHEINPAGMVFNFFYNNNKVEEIKAVDMGNLEFSFNNESATPSTKVLAKYTQIKMNGNETETKVFKTEFYIQVLARKWKSMTVKQYPVTKGILLGAAEYDDAGNIVLPETRTPSTTIQNIIQGDAIDLTSGEVEVTFDDNTTQTYIMSDNLLRVYNKRTTEKSEIQGVTIEPLEKKDVPAGDCFLDYTIKVSESLYIYDDEPTIKISARDKDGNAVEVITSNEKKLIEVEDEQIYTITITASVVTTELIDGVMQDVVLITAKSYKILATNAIEPRNALNISSAGDYELSIIFMENTDWSIPMNVRVVSRAPLRMELSNYSDINDKEYIVGDKVNIAFVKYRMVYDNGDIDQWAPVESRMLSPEVTLTCDYPSTQRAKSITFTLYGITSISLAVNIVPVRVVFLELEEPTNTYIAQGAKINPTGGILTAYMNNNTKIISSLINIIGSGEDKAQIINDPNSNDNSRISTDGPYIATIIYRQNQITFEYYVVERLVESLQLSRDGTEKTTYFENEPIDLKGLSLKVKWRGSDITDSVAVTTAMLYQYDPYKLGTQTIKLRYRGVLNISFSIDVLPRQIVEITILQKPKAIYIYGVDNSLDLSAIRISKRHNDGSVEEQIGINLKNEGDSYGWYYNKSEINFRLLGENQTVNLSYVDYYNIDMPLTITFEMEVKQKPVETFYINPTDRDDPANTQELNLAIVSKGMELNLKKWNTDTQSIGNSFILVKYQDIDKLREFPLTSNMVNYEKSDITLGIRKVKVTFDSVSINAYVTISDSYLHSVSIETYPQINYMIGDTLNLSGGTVRRTFHSNNSEDTRTDYVPMQVEGSTISGFDSSLKESDYDIDESYKERVITIIYMGLSYSYTIKIYKKFDANVAYYSSISFYGDVSLPRTEVFLDVEGFDVPNYQTEFINRTDIISELPSGFVEIIERDSDNHIMHITYQVGADFYIKLRMENGAIGYINLSLVMNESNYPTNPAQGVNKYFILVRIEGNRYYNALNYAQKEFQIIKKYIGVNTVVPNESAKVWRFNTKDDNNPRAVFLVSNYIEKLMQTQEFAQSGLNMILASPSHDYFEIIIISNRTYDLEMLKQNLIGVITAPYWSYIDANGNIKETNTNPNIEGLEARRLELYPIEESVGVNTRVFNEGNETLSYYVPLGGLIAVRDNTNYFIMELFEGSIGREVGENVLYNVNGELINGYDIEDDQMVVGTKVVGYNTIVSNLTNKNYFINFQSQLYTILPKNIIEVEFMATAEEKVTYKDKEYSVVTKGFDGTERFVEAKYKVSNEDSSNEGYDFDKSQMRYYKIDGETETLITNGYPTEIGMYRVRITNNYKAQEGYENFIEWECLLEITT